MAKITRAPFRILHVAILHAAIFGVALLGCGSDDPLPEPSPSPDHTTVAAPPPPGKLVPTPTDIDDPIAHAICKDVALYRAGTFVADAFFGAFFGLDDAASVSAAIDSYVAADASSAVSGLTLSFHRKEQRGDDATHGAFLHETARLLRMGVGGQFPEVNVGTYADRLVYTLEKRSLCFADGVGARAEDVREERIEGATIVITARTDKTIEGVITTKDNAHRLDFKAPIATADYPKVGPLCCIGPEPKLGASKLAPACATKPAGTFIADPSLGLTQGTTLEAYLDKRYFGDTDRLGVFLRLELRGPATNAQDQYGDSRQRRRTTFTVPLDTTYPTIPPGTYNASTFSHSQAEHCYSNGLGYSTLESGTPGGDGKLTITSQTETEIAGVLELSGGRFDFRTPITPTPAEVETYPRCCRE